MRENRKMAKKQPIGKEGKSEKIRGKKSNKE